MSSKLNYVGGVTLGLWLVGGWPAIAAESQVSEQSVGTDVQPLVGRVKDVPQAATTVTEWIAQVEAAAVVRVTGVRVERAGTGLDIVLETAEGKLLQVDATRFRAEGNSLIADIPNAVLALPEGQSFTAENPTEEIAAVQVVPEGGSIRVVVTGMQAVPRSPVSLKAGDLAYSLNPKAAEPEEEIAVTGQRVDGGYRVPNSSTVTRTDTPLRDIPQSIQIIPQEVLRDQRADISSALINAPSVRNSAQDLNWVLLVRFYRDGRSFQVMPITMLVSPKTIPSPLAIA
jgi:iron complex outermembrane receptor protein